MKCKQFILLLLLYCLSINYSILLAQPTIANFNPKSGAAGTLVSITGTNLSNPLSINIGGKAAIPISNNGSILVVMVMPGTTTGTVVITTAGGTATGAGVFTLTTDQAAKTQEGNKLVSADTIGAAQQGYSVAVSADGNTAIVGGYNDNNEAGAAWVYTRNGGIWTQQGNKLFGTDTVGRAQQGRSVALSADGNTALVGGIVDGGYVGAVWVFIRKNGVWSQQGNKLVGNGAIGVSSQGQSVSLSADGNTAIIGGNSDSSGAGAAWVFTRSDLGVWSQQGNKLVGTGAISTAQQGYSVSLSADGNTALVGGKNDNSGAGATWVFVRSFGVWSQQGNKLVGTDSSGKAQQGNSVAISADGNTAIIGGNYDNNYAGAAWIFSRNNGVWSQQGNKLVGTGTLGVAQQGVSVSISADGNTAMVGGFGDSSLTGAAWMFTRNSGIWSQQGKKLVGTGATGNAGMGQSVALSADGYTAIIGGNTDNKNNGAVWVFTYIPPPTINNISPISGPVGTLVTISGINLLNLQSIIIGGKAAIPISNDGATLVAMVMPGATTGAVTINTVGGPSNFAGNFSVLSAQSPKAQQGNKLVGSGAIGNAQQGLSVAISADGNTAVVGGGADNNNVGAAWVYTKTSGVWSQQGNKLVGDTTNSGGLVQASQGQSVAISADGNTIIVGGYNDNGGIGAAWVYTRSGGIWKQQGNKLIGTGGSATTRLGYSVSLSADGNTAVVGGSGDNGGVGAAWIYSRNSAGVWSQQGNKLVGTGGSTDARQGYALSLSADGNTLIVGGYNDNGGAGAAWVFTKSNGVWAQQGAKLVGTGAFGNASQGFSVSLNADGNTALVGGYLDSIGRGAAWVFTRSNAGVWSQQGNKLISTGFVGIPSLGRSVSLNADGNLAMVGGYGDSSNVGAAWYFIRNNGSWTQNGNKIVGTGGTLGARQGFSVSISADGINAIMGGYLDNNQTGAAWLFNYIPPPTITNFSPKSGPIGSLVTITGSNLSSTSSITIGGVAAIPISNDGNNVVVMVMPSTLNGSINLVTVGGSISSIGNFSVTSIKPPNIQQGNKLVGTGLIGNTQQGYSVAISANGNTAIVGAKDNNGGEGAALVYTRENGKWAQQTMLVGGGGSRDANQGSAVSISADGNTAIVGGYKDANGNGAVWGFVKINGTWFQQGPKLVGTGNLGASSQGVSVSLSADGNTAIIGGNADAAGVGAAWIFKRSGGLWTQQGNKLISTDAIGNTQQGISVSLSADGNTAIVGGSNDNNGIGAAWVYTLTGTNWTQQGNKLIGTGAIGNANQGVAVSINADGNTAFIGGNADSTGVGAAWAFTRTGGVWSQQGNKLIVNGAVGITNQGNSVSISADGNTAIVGGNTDSTGAGAAWVYTRSAGLWNQVGKKLFGSDAVGAANQGRSVALSADGITAIVGGNVDNASTGASWIFTYVPPPTINSFSPTTGPIGTLVTINGSNLLNANSVVIAGKSSIIISNDGTTLVAMVMPGASLGAVIVSSIGGSTSSGNFTVTPTLSPNIQQGQKLVGTLGSSNAQQGYSVAISADGNTAIVGGYNDNNLAGAAWVYVRNGNVWTQQGNKLIGIGGSATAQQGWSVAINADGNTAVVGGYNDKGGVGAAWIFTRNNAVWTQQGEKLVGTGIEGLGNAQQGYSVSISADGNTMIMGGNGDNFLVGAAWIFTRNNGVWKQLGNKLVGAGVIGNARQGQSVSMSAEGKTAIVGGFNDNGGVGAVWVYALINGAWIQQGNKLIGTGAIGNGQQGNAIAINADGSTIIVGAKGDNNGAGAAWVFTRGGGGIWTQQGNKLSPTDTVGVSGVGQAVSISADGTIIMVGGSTDNGNIGAVWAFKRNASVWTQQGNKLVGTGAVGNARQGFSLSLSADGNTAITGGLNDNNNNGAVWVFTNIPASTITAATYNVATGNLVVTGINFISTTGPLNDIEVSRLSITGEGNTVYTLTSNNVEINSATNFTIQLNSTDSAALSLILNKNGTSSTDGTTYNLAADDFWMSASIAGGADLTGNGITVNNVAVPTIVSANYNLSSGLLQVTANGLLKRNGSSNDIDVSKLSFTGQGGKTYQLKNTSDVEITNTSSFSISLNSTDKDSVNALLNKNGTSAVDGTVYNLAAADDWNRGADAAINIADLTGNAITVRGFPEITITNLFSITSISTVYGSASNYFSFSIAGSFLQAGILATAPIGFEVSLDTTTYSNSITVGAAGSLVNTRIYVRLKSGLLVNNYSGNIVLSSTNASNVLVPTPTGTVTPKELTITGITANNKAFDGNTIATLSGTAKLNGVLIADTANIRIGGTPIATFARSNIGINIAVTVVGYTIAGSAANNYSVIQPSGLRGNIFDADVSIMPNPFFSDLIVQLNVAATSNTSNTTVRLLSLSGREYKSVTVARGVSRIQLYGAELLAGVYLVEIKNDKYQQTKLVYKY